MSFRGLKRMLGESSLERKTRWLLGAGVFTLMVLSFGFYARQTEDLAFDQFTQTGRALVTPFIARLHVRGELREGMDEFTRITEEKWPSKLRGYKYQLIRPTIPKPENQPSSEDLAVLAEFKDQPDATELTREVPSEQAYFYYGAVRAGHSCVACHRDSVRMAQSLGPDLAPPTSQADAALNPGDLMAVVSVRLSTDSLEAGLHTNRAILIAFAVGTTILILAGSYAVIRFVIVRPVKHLKSVADAIAAGQLNVRSEIQSGDEFEDLSDAFNRMLRNLVTAQDDNRKLIGNLDRKVDELAHRNLELHESNRIKGDFLSTMSHELRTPLNSIIGFSEVLLTDDAMTPKQHRWAGNIMTGGQQLLALINDILDLAKLESGKMRLHPTTIPPEELCRQVTALFRPAAAKKNVELRDRFPKELAPVTQDGGKLTQILTNLISNAIKFTPEGGRVTVGAERLGDKLILTVADTGVGIAPAEQEVIFDKFRQASNPLTREQGGTGLGLSIVRELAKLLGGDVSLQSDLGRGSTFTVTVAAKLPDHAARFEPEEPIDARLS